MSCGLLIDGQSRNNFERVCRSSIGKEDATNVGNHYLCSVTLQQQHHRLGRMVAATLSVARLLLYGSSELRRPVSIQGTQMERSMFDGRFYIPSASLSLFNIGAIIALIPVYDRVFVPLLHKFGGKLSLLQRIGAGFPLVSYLMSYVLCLVLLDCWRAYMHLYSQDRAWTCVLTRLRWIAELMWDEASRVGSGGMRAQHGGQRKGGAHAAECLPCWRAPRGQVGPPSSHEDCGHVRVLANTTVPAGWSVRSATLHLMPLLYLAHILASLLNLCIRMQLTFLVSSYCQTDIAAEIHHHLHAGCMCWLVS